MLLAAVQKMLRVVLFILRIIVHVFLLIKQNARGFGGSRIMGRVLARADEQMMYLIMCQL